MSKQKTTEDYLNDLEELLSKEIQSFEESARVARERDKPKWEIYCLGVADAYRLCRSVLHVKILHEKVISGDVLTVWLLEHISKSLPSQLESDLLSSGAVKK